MTRSGSLRAACTLLILLLVPLASAHAELLSSQPANRTVIETVPAQAVLEFSEPVEVPFSTFKVYRLEADMPEAEPSERDWQRLSGLAGVLVGEVVTSREDTDARIDSGISTSERRSARIVIDLEESMEPGAYVLMWRALSIDTHIVQGFVTFIVAPED